MSTLFWAEEYANEGQSLIRKVRCRDGRVAESRVKRADGQEDTGHPDADFDAAWLRATSKPEQTERHGVVSVVDVFAGCGGLTLGVQEACRALGLEMEPRLAVDLDNDALSIYGHNFPTADIKRQPVEELVRIAGGRGHSRAESDLVRDYGGVDLLIGGPPCQGHSSLNNHTRWTDSRNELYMSMARFSELLGPAHVIIENVPGVERDGDAVAQRTWARLRELGYSVSTGILDSSHLGTAQVRRRSVTIASRTMTPSVPLAQEEAAVAGRSLGWAIGDLQVDEENAPFDTPSTSNKVNQARIDFLFDHGVYDLPNDERPDCHRLKKHSYTPMYGRLRWDRAARTITTGFGSIGRGRFVHPQERRLITPHEAARIQGFPDYFSFSRAGRSLLHKTIGNAVPPKMGYAVGLHLLR